MIDVDFQARERAIQREIEVLRAARARSPWNYRLERLWMRSLRVAWGLISLGIGFVLIDAAPSITDTPFAALTLGMLFKAAAGWGFGAWFMVGAFTSTFGAGPSRQEIEEALRSEAQNIVDRRPPILASEP